MSNRLFEQAATGFGVNGLRPIMRTECRTIGFPSGLSRMRTGGSRAAVDRRPHHFACRRGSDVEQMRRGKVWDKGDTSTLLHISPYSSSVRPRTAMSGIQRGIAGSVPKWEGKVWGGEHAYRVWDPEERVSEVKMRAQDPASIRRLIGT